MAIHALAALAKSLGPKLAELAKSGLTAAAKAPVKSAPKASELMGPSMTAPSLQAETEEKEAKQAATGAFMRQAGKPLGAFGSRTAELMGQQSPFAAAGGGLSSLGEKMGESGMGTSGALVKFTGTLIESVDKLRTWTNTLHESNMKFAEFSGSMKAVQAEAEVREFYLKRSQGEAQAPSARRLAGAQADFNEAAAPIENLWAQIKNTFGTGLLRFAEPIVRSLGIVANWIAEKPSDSQTHSTAADVDSNSSDVTHFARDWMTRSDRPAALRRG